MKYITILMLSVFLLTTNLFSQKLEYKMIMAAAKGDIGTVKKCLKKGAKIDARNRARWTALAYAAKYNHMNIVKLLVEKGANVNRTINTGSTPFQVALNRNNYNIADYLIKNNANINNKDITGMTALAWAAKAGRLKEVKYLVEHGADVNSKNNNARSILDITINEKIKEYLRSQGAKTSKEMLES